MDEKGALDFIKHAQKLAAFSILALEAMKEHESLTDLFSTDIRHEALGKNKTLFDLIEKKSETIEKQDTVKDWCDSIRDVFFETDQSFNLTGHEYVSFFADIAAIATSAILDITLKTPNMGPNTLIDRAKPQPVNFIHAPILTPAP